MCLAERIVSHLPPNVIACSIRSLTKAAAAHFSAPQHVTVRLSNPVPPDAFAQRWDRPGSMRGLTQDARRVLLRLTAASGGSTANLEVAIARCGLLLDTDLYEATARAGDLDACKLLWQQPWVHGKEAERRRDTTAMLAAAAAGKHDVCRWLREQHGVAWDANTMAAAARPGHLATCQALRDAGCPWDEGVVKAAAAAGHAELCWWLVENGCPWHVHRALEAAAASGHHALVLELARRSQHQGAYSDEAAAAAAGCDLLTLQAVLGPEPRRRPARTGASDAAAAAPRRDLSSADQERVTRAAMLSPTDDWRDKVTWLVDAHGFAAARDAWLARDDALMGRGAASPEAASALLARITWLTERGYAAEGVASEVAERLLKLAARNGNVPVLELLLSAGVAPVPSVRRHAARSAAGQGHLAALQLLHAYGCEFGAEEWPEKPLATAAARSGRVAMVAWVADVLGAGQVCKADVMAAAAASGCRELVAWLRERGCPWDADAFAAAAAAGCQELLEWMAENGCPMGKDGRAYSFSGSNGDMAVLNCLRRLDCPWNSYTFSASMDPFASRPSPPLPVLRWMVDQGFPVRFGQVHENSINWFRQAEDWLMDLASEVPNADDEPSDDESSDGEEGGEGEDDEGRSDEASGAVSSASCRDDKA